MRSYMPGQSCRVVLILIVFTCKVFAQNHPPTQGPLPPQGTTTQSFSMSILLNFMESEIQQAIDSLNMKIEKQKDTTGVQTRLSYSYKAFPPYMTATAYKDQPNHNYMRMPLIITYDLIDTKWKGTPYATRKIHQFVDVIATCKNWSTEQGALNFTLDMQKPYADDRPSSQQLLNFFVANKLTALIDRQVQHLLPAFKQSMDSTVRCNCFDVNPGKDQANNYKDSEIRYNYYNGLPAADNIEISLVSLTRLYARSYPDFKVIYKEEEDVQLVFYANQIQRIISVNKIKEEQERRLDVEKIIFPKPTSKDLLVFIANLKLKQLPDAKKSTEIAIFNKYSNFGNGLQKIIFYKSYQVQLPPLPSGEIPKPYVANIAAYELTVHIGMAKPEAIMANGTKLK